VASITLGEAEATFSVALSPIFVASLLPTRKDSPQDERVEPRKSAVAEQSVGLEAVLGHAEVSIRELALLAVGDVIVMEESLSDPGSLQIEGGGRVCRVVPGRLDGQRAVQFRGKIQ
jgi:flagellar motor switch protein FliM